MEKYIGYEIRGETCHLTDNRTIERVTKLVRLSNQIHFYKKKKKKKSYVSMSHKISIPSVAGIWMI